MDSQATGLFFAGSTIVATDTPEPPGDKKATASDTEKTSVLQILDDQQAAWNKGDLKGFMNGYWNSPDLSFYSGRDKRAGWRETFERYQKRYQAEGKEMGKVAFSDVEIEMLGKKAAVVRGRWGLTMSDGKKMGGLYTLIFRHFKKAGWKIIHDHTSSDQ